MLDELIFLERASPNAFERPGEKRVHRIVIFIGENGAHESSVGQVGSNFSSCRMRLVTNRGNAIIQGSDRILDWTGIGGANPDLEKRLADTIGPLVRQYIYSATLDDPKAGIRDLLFEGVPLAQAWLGRLAWPITRRLMIASMNAHSSLTQELEQKLSSELDWFDGQVGGRHHLAGNAFGRTDITAASMLAPLAEPSACHLYRREGVLPERLEETLARWRKWPGLQWTERIYTDHRQRSQSQSVTPGFGGGEQELRAAFGVST